MDNGHPSLPRFSGCAGQDTFPSKHMQTVHKPPLPSHSKPQGAKAWCLQRLPETAWPQLCPLRSLAFGLTKMFNFLILSRDCLQL